MALSEKGRLTLDMIQKYFTVGTFSAKSLSDVCGEKISAASLTSLAKRGYLNKFQTSPVTYSFDKEFAENCVEEVAPQAKVLNTNLREARRKKDALTEKWKDYGLIVEQVSIQNVVYPDSIKDKYSEAAAAEIAKTTAENQKEVAQVEADTKVVQANGEAEANRVLAESLSSEVLTSKYIDALANAQQLVVVPDGSSPIIKSE